MSGHDFGPPGSTNVDPLRHLTAFEWHDRLDGVTLAPERAQHLASCSVCLAEERRWLAMGRALKELPRRDLPAGLSEAIQARLSVSDTGLAGMTSTLPRWLDWWGRPLGLAAAAAVLLLTVLTTQIMRAEPEEWSPDAAWVVGLPSPVDPLASEWAGGSGLEELDDEISPGGDSIGVTRSHGVGAGS